MFIGTKELLRLVREQRLVENLSERELTNPEGTGFDLRVGAVYKIRGGESFLGESERYTPEVDEIASFASMDDRKEIILEPGDYVLVKTIEKLNLPENIAVIFRPRSTLFRSGVSLHTATASPGYSGELTFGMANHSQSRFRLEMGARIVHALFVPVSGDLVSTYRGQWQGGRVSTQGNKEEQV